MEEAEALRDLRVLDHAAAHERDLAIELRGQIDDDLHPVEARRERRDDDLAFGAREDLLERVLDVGFRSGIAAAIDVGAVAEHRQHAFRSELREPVQIECLAVDRSLIDLEVAGVEQHALRRAHDDSNAIGHAVGHAHEFERERAHYNYGTRFDLDGLRFQLMFVELVLDDAERERGSVHRTVQVRQHVRHAADVVFVRVRQADGLELTLPVIEIGEIGNDQIDAGQIGLWEHRAGVDDDGRLPTRDGHHVEAELAEAAKRHDIHWWRAGRALVHTHSKSQPDLRAPVRPARPGKAHEATFETRGGSRIVTYFRPLGGPAKRGGFSSETITQSLLYGRAEEVGEGREIRQPKRFRPSLWIDAGLPQNLASVPAGIRRERLQGVGDGLPPLGEGGPHHADRSEERR